MIIRVNKKENDKSIRSHNGLSNAAKATYESLYKSNLDVSYHYVIDNNEIYLGCEQYKPDYVIIDGLWVVPSKFEELNSIYPNIKWIIRMHSDIPFIAQEGIFSEWMYKYVNLPKVYVAFNSKTALDIVQSLFKDRKEKIVYLPNMYKLSDKLPFKPKPKSDTIKISIFGAARVLKNQFLQAIVALELAEKLNKKLELSINVNTKDVNGLPIYLNIIHLLKDHPSKKHSINLVEWSDRDKFLSSVKDMDIGMQVSFTETFNLVCADHIECNVPILGTNEIPWMHFLYKVDPLDHKQILNRLLFSYKYPKLNVYLNRLLLIRYTEKSIKQWEKLFNIELKSRHS